MLSIFPTLSLPCTILYITSISLLFEISQDNMYNEQIKSEPEEFDFIIVGAGSAGCVVANRLTENNEWTSLLLEAGKEEPLASEVPGLYNSLAKTQLDWNYRTQPDENSCLLEGGCPLPRGKVMGGSSSINFMLYVRGNREDYNTWAKMGNPGWSYNDVLPYFKKSENNGDQNIVRDNPEYHATGGYQTIERFPYLDPNAEIVLQALEELGYNQTDINGETQLGSTIIQTTSINGSRQSANAAFIRPIRQSRKNLFIKTQVYVTKILIDSETKRAFGVEYTSFTGDTKTVFARKEVIVSAGSIESPKLLMLSGIGPTEELEKHDIALIKNLSVGHNLHDHVASPSIYCNVDESSPVCERKVKDLNTYFNQKRGPLSSIGISTVTAFSQTQYEQSPGVPDIQYVFLGYNKLAIYYEKFLVMPYLLAPKSKGFIKLDDADPVWGAPKINPRYLSEDIDVIRLINASREILRIFNTTAFKRNNFTFDETLLQPCNKFEFNSDEYWLCQMREYTTTMMHCVGTCKMGPKEDTEAVVDARLRVYGIKGLRVIDASIMPIIPRGNTNAPTLMIAEKGSDMIKEDWL